MKTAKKAGYYIVSVVEAAFIAFIALVALMNLVMLVQYKILMKPVPTFFGYSYVNVLSGSMEPMVSTGDLAICKVQDEYDVGDVVLFEDGDYLIMHRIVDVNEDGSYATKGDANNVNDENPVWPENIYGEYVCDFDGLGETLAYLTSWVGAFWSILVALFIFLMLDIGKDLIKESMAQMPGLEEADSDEDESDNDGIQEGDDGYCEIELNRLPENTDNEDTEDVPK